MLPSLCAPFVSQFLYARALDGGWRSTTPAAVPLTHWRCQTHPMTTMCKNKLGCDQDRGKLVLMKLSKFKKRRQAAVKSLLLPILSPCVPKRVSQVSWRLEAPGASPRSSSAAAGRAAPARCWELQRTGRGCRGPQLRRAPPSAGAGLRLWRCRGGAGRGQDVTLLCGKR